MSEKGKVCICLISCSMQPNECLFWLVKREGDGVILGMPEDLRYFGSSHVVIIIVILASPILLRL